MKTNPGVSYRNLSDQYRQDLGLERGTIKTLREENKKLSERLKLKNDVNQAGVRGKESQSL